MALVPYSRVTVQNALATPAGAFAFQARVLDDVRAAVRAADRKLSAVQAAGTASPQAIEQALRAAEALLDELAHGFDPHDPEQLNESVVFAWLERVRERASAYEAAVAQLPAPNVVVNTAESASIRVFLLGLGAVVLGVGAAFWLVRRR